MVGGICALVGAKILGPRIGKYDKEGNARAIPGHNLSIAALGVFILSGSAGSVSTAALPQLLPQTSVISQ